MKNLILFAGLLLSSCMNPMPQKPSDETGVSLPFICTYHGFPVLQGWLVVDEKVFNQIEKYDIDYLGAWLECTSAQYDNMNCYIDDQMQ